MRSSKGLLLALGSAVVVVIALVAVWLVYGGDARKIRTIMEDLRRGTRVMGDHCPGIVISGGTMKKIEEALEDAGPSRAAEMAQRVLSSIMKTAATSKASDTSDWNCAQIANTIGDAFPEIPSFISCLRGEKKTAGMLGQLSLPRCDALIAQGYRRELLERKQGESEGEWEKKVEEKVKTEEGEEDPDEDRGKFE